MIDWNALVTPGTAINAKLDSMLDSIAAGIYDLAKSGVTVIYRPYHESDGNWFWWGTGSGDGVGGANPTSAQFIALWRYTHDYISNKAGPNGLPLGSNIAWAFTGVDESTGCWTTGREGNMSILLATTSTPTHLAATKPSSTLQCGGRHREGSDRGGVRSGDQAV